MTKQTQDLFSSLTHEFAKLDTKEKSNEIIDREKIILEDLVRYAQEKDIEANLLKASELAESNDESLNIMMAYLLNIEVILNEIMSLK